MGTDASQLLTAAAVHGSAIFGYDDYDVGGGAALKFTSGLELVSPWFRLPSASIELMYGKLSVSFLLIPPEATFL